MRRWLPFVLAAVLAFLILRGLFVSEEDRIKKVLMDGKEAIEREDLKGVMDHISLFYRDDYGFTYLRIKGLLQRLFEEFDDIKIYVERMEVDVEEEGRATAWLLTWATARGKEGTGYIACSGQQPCQVKVELQKGKTGWKVTRTTGVEPGEVLL